MPEKCCVCSKNVPVNHEWVCEVCGGIHHPKCSGDNYEGCGECPSEEAYSICKKCVVAMKTRVVDDGDNLWIKNVVKYIINS